MSLPSVRQPPSVQPSKVAPRLLKHIVWLRGVDWALPRQEVQRRIQDGLPPGSGLQHAEAPGFETDKQRRKHQHHQVAISDAARVAGDHKGYALISFETPEAATAAIPVLQGLPLAKDGLEVLASLAPAALLPPSFPEQARYSVLEWEQKAVKDQYAVERRVKLKRQRNRRREQNAQSLADMLAQIPAPGGPHALHAYVSLHPAPHTSAANAKSSPKQRSMAAQGLSALQVSTERDQQETAQIDLPSDHMMQQTLGPHLDSFEQPCQAPTGPNVDLQSSGSQLASSRPVFSIDWSALPDSCQVAARSLAQGTKDRSSASDWSCSDSESDISLTDYSSAGKAGAQAVPLRVRRKRAQVESFAYALSKLLDTQPADLQAPNTCTESSQHPSPYTSCTAENGSCGAQQQQQQQPVAHVAEFGSGSGNLLLPLASLFPHCHFHAVDYKAQSVAALLDRARAAGLSNVTGSVQRIEDYSGPLDVALALHACGAATDYAMLQAVRSRAAYIVSPCCIGKLQNLALQAPSGADQAGMHEPGCLTAGAAVKERAVQGGPDRPSAQQQQTAVERRTIAQLLTHPRSRWLTNHLPSPPTVAFQQLAIAADISHGDNHGHAEAAQLAKVHVELDRNKAAEEQGYKTVLTRLFQPELHQYKADLMLGVPEERIGTKYTWEWG